MCLRVKNGSERDEKQVLRGPRLPAPPCPPVGKFPAPPGADGSGVMKLRVQLLVSVQVLSLLEQLGGLWSLALMTH